MGSRSFVSKVPFLSHRPVVMGTNGMVASAHPLASQAGIRMLMQGGNAIDAAVATAAVLNVVEPEMSGLGGDAFLLIFMKKKNELRALNGTGAAPYEAKREFFLNDGIPRKGIRSVSTPGALDSWMTALETYGTMTLKQVFQPAIEYAEEGFPITERLAQAIQTESTNFSLYPTSSKIFLKYGNTPKAGQILIQKDLAGTFKKIADGGREAFYKGEIAKEIIRFSKEQGGLLSERDFAEQRSRWDEPISTTYRGYTVHEFPPNSSGHILLQELNIVELFDMKQLGHYTADSIHMMVEAKKLAFADRERYNADPEYTDIPLKEMISKEYARKQVTRIQMNLAATEIPPGNPRKASSDTTYFAVVDKEGNAVSHIQSLNMLFGSGVVAGNTGILLNNRMTYWHLEESHVNRLEPGKRVRHTMNPPMVFKDGKLFMVFGTPGGDYQVQTNLQVLTNVIDFGMDIQEAIEAPRWRSDVSGTLTNYPHTGETALIMEDRVPPDVREDLARKGHLIRVVGGWEGGCNAQGIIIDPESGALMGGSDPRRASYTIGW